MRVAALLVIAGVIGALAWWWQAGTHPAADAGRTEHSNTGTTPAQPYAGSERCADCHRDIYRAWRASQHAQAERALAPQGEDAAALAAMSSVATRTVVEQGLPTATAEDPHRGLTRVLGVTPLRQFLVPMSGGRVQVTSAAWDPARGEWFDVFADGRKPGEWGHWRGRGMNWNSMCARCHNTGVTKGWNATTDRYATRVTEHGVGCEACHGALGTHAQRKSEGADDSLVDAPGVTPASTSAGAVAAARTMATCGACHARRSELTLAYRPGDAFDDHFILTLVGDGSSDNAAFHADGQVREEDFEYAAFLGSRMYAAGVTCGDCHDPHTGRPRSEGNGLCQRCHAPGARADAPDIDDATHSHHAATSAGHACVGCHMPQTTYMQRDPRRDHGFTTPDPWLTRELGIPNACNRCHAKESAQWALDRATAWYGARLTRPARARTLTIAAARKGDGDPATARALEQLLASREQPVWRASAALLAGPWVGEPGLHAALVRALDDPAPEVRMAAARSLGEIADQDAAVAATLRPRLQDRSRAVRVTAAWALRAELDPASPAGRDLQAMLAEAADQPAGQLRLGQYHAARAASDPAAAERAVRHMRTAIAWDPNSAPPRRDLAVLQAQLGDIPGALASMAEAVRLAPTVGSFHYELGLLRNEAGDAAGTRTAFERAVALDPTLTRAWYNLGLARAAAPGASRQDLEGALRALARAEALAAPVSGARSASAADIPFAAATLQLRLGRTDAARAAVQRALALDPGHPQANALAAQLAAPDQASRAAPALR